MGFPPPPPTADPSLSHPSYKSQTLLGSGCEAQINSPMDFDIPINVGFQSIYPNQCGTNPNQWTLISQWTLSSCFDSRIRRRRSNNYLLLLLLSPYPLQSQSPPRPGPPLSIYPNVILVKYSSSGDMHDRCSLALGGHRGRVDATY